MRISLALSFALLCAVPAAGQKNKKQVDHPAQFEIGVFTYFDFGPPFNYYSLYVVRPGPSGTQVERLIFTPGSDNCFLPARVEKATAVLPESVQRLLGDRNPCAIPEKALKHELKRCKHCPNLSGANIAMQVSCAGQTRVIHSSVLDKDWFDPAANTPQNSSWTLALLNKLDKAAGPGVMDKPAILPGYAEIGSEPSKLDPEIARIISSGDYNALFPEKSETLSNLFEQTQKIRPRLTEVSLREISPLRPETLLMPTYPAVTERVHPHESVRAIFIVGADGSPSLAPPMLDGAPQLQKAVANAVSKWKFPPESVGQQVMVIFDFDIHCPD